jgi:hypothetical protein
MFHDQVWITSRPVDGRLDQELAVLFRAELMGVVLVGAVRVRLVVPRSVVCQPMWLRPVWVRRARFDVVTGIRLVGRPVSRGSARSAAVGADSARSSRPGVTRPTGPAAHRWPTAAAGSCQDGGSGRASPGTEQSGAATRQAPVVPSARCPRRPWPAVRAGRPPPSARPVAWQRELVARRHTGHVPRSGDAAAPGATCALSLCAAGAGPAPAGGGTPDPPTRARPSRPRPDQPDPADPPKADPPNPPAPTAK